MIMAPWFTHFSITFFFSGSFGVSFGPPGISTCVSWPHIDIAVGDDADKEDVDHLVNVDNLLMGLIDRVAVMDQDRHGAGRVDITKVLNTLDKRRLEHRERGRQSYFCLPATARRKAVVDELCFEAGFAKTRSHLSCSTFNRKTVN